MALFSRFFGSTISEAAGFALGGAMRSPLEPPLVELTNETWARFVDTGITIPTEPGVAAEIAAEDVASVGWAKDQAKQRGVGGDQMDKIIGAVLNAPDLGTLYRSWRRGDITGNDFTHGLRKARLETMWDGALAKLKDERLPPDVVARAIQRGLIPDPGILPVGPPGGGGNVPAFPVFNVDALSEAAAFGLDRERLSVQVGLVGNPMGAHEAAQAQFRGVLTDNDYRRAIAEGNTRNEWADAIREQSRQIPTTHEYVENTLRGYSDLNAMRAGAARHGMTPDDVNVLFQNAGRPLNIHQITTGLARGGKFQPIPGELTDPFEAASHESNLKPSYYDLNIANRYVIPSVLAIRQLATSGVWDAPTTEQRLLWSGWYPPDAHDVAQAWARGSATSAKEATVTDLLTLWDGNALTAADTHAAIVALGYPAAEAQRKMDTVEARRVSAATNSAIGDLHTSYKKGDISTAHTLTALESLGLSNGAAQEIERRWRVYLTAIGGQPAA